jgi:periplasmic copper chaperone A
MDQGHQASRHQRRMIKRPRYSALKNRGLSVFRTLVVIFIAVAVLGNAPSAAHSYRAGDIQVRHPWTRATPPGAKTGAGYLEIRNSGKEADRLIGASTLAAERVELHVTMRDGDIVSMREAKSFEIPGRQRFSLRPGGPHLMLVGLAKPLEKGQRIPLVLRFQRAGELQVELEVQAADSRKPHH